MIILKLTNDTYFTDKLDKDSMPGFYVFDTTTKAGKVQHHILAQAQVMEIVEQEGTVEDTRKPKEI